MSTLDIQIFVNIQEAGGFVGQPLTDRGPIGVGIFVAIAIHPPMLNNSVALDRAAQEVTSRSRPQKPTHRRQGSPAPGNAFAERSRDVHAHITRPRGKCASW